MSKQGYTLVEIVSVILLLSILVLGAISAFHSTQRSIHRQQAMIEAGEIAQAAMEYHRVYGIWPNEQEAAQGEDTSLVATDRTNPSTTVYPSHLDLADVMKTLMAADTKHNPRGIVFVELPSRCLKYSDAANGTADWTPRDPWGNPYVLVMSRGATQTSVPANMVSRIEGGVACFIVSKFGSSAKIDSPENAVAFSWGDFTQPTNSALPSRIIGSWSER